ncbi:MAG: HNH endonuclease signature motif containing protein [Firmicutes bacterium]|nr:HNH endonuclease signature motif containing protein [Bacillota bacterium]MDY5857508.1 HNH endonuclease signature motif containing protein [Anaerovoracaceae bacterium]
MKINRKNAMRLWNELFGDVRFAEDFHGNLMCKDGYGDPEFFVYDTNEMFFGQRNKIFCGWNIHHILPVAAGGTNAKKNLICTNIATNEEAEDKITFWVDDSLYQVKKIRGTSNHEIVKIE